jgi:hypothetical protein
LAASGKEAVRSSVPQDLFFVREETGVDYGADLILEMVDGEDVTNFRIYLQIKATNQSSRDSSTLFTHPVEIKTVEYLSIQPSIFVVWSASTGTLWWDYCVEILRAARTRERKQLKNIPRKTIRYGFSRILNEETWGMIHRNCRDLYHALRSLALNPDIPVRLESEAMISLRNAAEVFLHGIKEVSPPWFFAQRFLGVGIVGRETQPYWQTISPTPNWLKSFDLLKASFGNFGFWTSLATFGEVLKSYETITMDWYRSLVERAQGLSGLDILPRGGLGIKTSFGLTREFFATVVACVAEKYSRFLPASPSPSDNVLYDISLPSVKVHVPTSSGPYFPAWTHLPEELQADVSRSDFLKVLGRLPVIAFCDSYEQAQSVVDAHKTLVSEARDLPLTSEVFLAYCSASEIRRKCVGEIRGTIEAKQLFMNGPYRSPNGAPRSSA